MFHNIPTLRLSKLSFSKIEHPYIISLLYFKVGNVMPTHAAAAADDDDDDDSNALVINSYNTK